LKKGMTGYKKKLGALGEKIAAQHLQEVEGYKIIARNYTCFLGEIDIIVQDQQTIVFVEVRSGTLPFAGWAEESIGFRKQKKLRQLASYYLKEKGWQSQAVRFDVVILLFTAKSFCVQEIKLIKNAF
jgi:putative endonuclease